MARRPAISVAQRRQPTNSSFGLSAVERRAHSLGGFSLGASVSRLSSRAKKQ
jgi:hypothetical protein